MKTLGIVTIFDNNNYGNRLQNYALQEVLKERNFNVITFRNYHNKNESKFLSTLRRTDLFWLFRSIYFRLKHSPNSQRRLAFEAFTEKNIATSNVILTSDKQKIRNKSIDAVVIGSDQVWNYTFARFSNIDFASFVSEGTPIISYAASFGVSQIPKKLHQQYIAGLSRIKSLSVREISGQGIVRDIIKREVPIVLDPTLLLSTNQWKALASSSTFDTGSSYVLVYMLGELSADRASYINEYALTHKLKVKRLNDISDLELYTANPQDFVKLFLNAKVVFTDSFHACVFSVLFKKRFEIFNRIGESVSMNSRIESLIEILKLKTKNSEHGSQIIEVTAYTNIDVTLESAKTKSLKYLDRALTQLL